jgi:hypothetical protein
VFAKWINIKAKIIQMKELQELKNKWKKGIAVYQDFHDMCITFNWYSLAESSALAQRQLLECIRDVELLLCKDTGASTETAISQTPMLGECAAEVETSTVNESAAVSCATPAVRQNEQTKEVCPYCVANPCICWDNMR